MLLGGGEKFQRNFLQGLRQPQHSARDVMGAPVVNVSETTEAEEIARVLTRCCIKRVPVVHDSRVVGIEPYRVSRR
jgi:CBS domain-containing protein